MTNLTESDYELINYAIRLAINDRLALIDAYEGVDNSTKVVKDAVLTIKSFKRVSEKIERRLS